MNKPIKRSEELKHYSHDHHDALLLCWKIRKGLSQNVEPERIHKYAKWFYENHIVPHFEDEENLLFPILNKENELLARALKEHSQLHKLFNDQNVSIKNLEVIANKLDDHIRFEERILFGEIEATAVSKNISIPEHSHQSSCQVWEDNFWEKNKTD